MSRARTTRTPSDRRVRIGQALLLLRRRQQVVPSATVELASDPEKAHAAGTTDDELMHDPVMLSQLAGLRLGDENPDVRLAAVEVLMTSPALIKEHAHALARRLDDEAWYVRRAAISALSRLDPLPGRQAMDYFLPRFGDRCDEVRAAALQRIGRVDPAVLQDFAGAITRATQDTFWPARVAACSALGSIAQHGTSALEAHRSIDALATCLTDPAAGVRLAAINALAAFGAASVDAHVDVLARVRANDSESTEVKMAVERCLQLSRKV